MSTGDYQQRHVTPQEIEDYRRDGVVVLRRALSEEWVRRGAAAMQNSRGDADSHFVSWRSSDGSGESWIRHLPSVTNPALHHLVFESPLARLAAELMMSSSVSFIGDIIYCKEPGDMMPTDWHRDSVGLPVSGDQHCITWMSFDAIPRHLALEFIRSSNSRAPDSPTATGHPLGSDIEDSRANDDIIGWDTEPGDVIVFHVSTLHGARGAEGISTRRTTFSIRWAGDDVRYSGISAPTPFPDDDWEGFAPGDRVVSPRKPQVWPTLSTK